MQANLQSRKVNACLNRYCFKDLKECNAILLLDPTTQQSLNHYLLESNVIFQNQRQGRE